jgi:hypothetical protein
MFLGVDRKKAKLRGILDRNPANAHYSISYAAGACDRKARFDMARRHFCTIPVAAALMIFAAMPSAVWAGPDWEEICDAGSVPSSAQVVPIPSEVKSIRGKLGACSDSLGGPDFEDMYLILIDQPGIFCAQTVITSTDQFCCDDQVSPSVNTNFNTQLWLFAANGTGRLGNDNGAPFMTPGLSVLPNASDDGSGVVITVPGLYYLAISGGPNRDPFSSAGPMFQQLSTFEVSGPDGVGGGPNPIMTWNGAGVQGQYQILLCGVKGVPSIPTASEWSMIALAAAVMIAGAILIARKGRMTAADVGMAPRR